LYSSAVEDPTITSCTTIQGGTYTVVVTDANSCTATANTNVVVSPGIAANLISINPLCYQGNTGQITVNVTAGTPNYTYAWSNGSTSNPATGLAAGTSICVTITDASTCTISLCKTLVDPADLVVTTTSVPTQCGFLDGEINVNAVGGAGGYTYSWSEGGFLTANITGLHPGDYTVTVRDVNNCSEIVTETVGFFGAGTVSITQLQDILCYGETTAVMTSQMSDGTLPFTYAWSVAGQNSANLSGQGAGSYSVSISDVYGCSGTATQIVTQPLQIDVSISSVDILCRGESDGSATVNVAGGIYPYVYAWDNGSTSSHISSLSAGTYSVTVKDINNCTMSEFVVINQPDKAVNINLVTSDVTCAGRYDGMALAQGDGGTAPYTVYWFQFGQLISSSIQVNSLSAGDFTVELFDVNNCAAEASFKIIEPSELIIGTEMSGVTCKGFNDGLIAVSAEGGTFPYSVAWSNGDTTFVASELLGGQYFVTVSDANGCLKGLGILLPENPILCLDIPNAFTPNADGVNDTWQIQYIEQYPAASVNIFNRWGQHIYQGSRDSEFWDGKFQDKFVPSGPYQYIIDLRNGMDPFTGVVVVVY
jgi:gliding motility-associated-like protein